MTVPYALKVRWLEKTCHQPLERISERGRTDVMTRARVGTSQSAAIASRTMCRGERETKWTRRSLNVFFSTRVAGSARVAISAPPDGSQGISGAARVRHAASSVGPIRTSIGPPCVLVWRPRAVARNARPPPGGALRHHPLAAEPPDVEDHHRNHEEQHDHGCRCALARGAVECEAIHRECDDLA